MRIEYGEYEIRTERWEDRPDENLRIYSYFDNDCQYGIDTNVCYENLYLNWNKKDRLMVICGIGYELAEAFGKEKDAEKLPLTKPRPFVL